MIIIVVMPRMNSIAIVNANELITFSNEDGGIIEDGAMLIKDGRVEWVGSTNELKRIVKGKIRVIDAKDKIVIPGMIDPHTHILFSGSREDEFEDRIMGKDYLSILREGGGILRTIRETRRASLDEIVNLARDRIRQMLTNGFTTIEVKTGYGQDLESELKLIKAIEKLSMLESVDLVPTLLALHARPDEFKDNREYLMYSINVILREVSKLQYKPIFSDCFCENGVFSRDECYSYLKASRELGFELKIHADEFSDSGGASLAAELDCISADHLAYSNEDALKELAIKGIVAVVLPCTSLYSRSKFADARLMIELGCRVALGTDLSPNSWVESPQFVMSIACNQLRMRPIEALKGFTLNAARAIKRNDIGRLDKGCKADFVIMNLRNHRFLAYRIGGNYVDSVFKDGEEVYRRPVR